MEIGVMLLRVWPTILWMYSAFILNISVIDIFHFTVEGVVSQMIFIYKIDELIPLCTK